MRILITGVTGFLGRHIARHLVALGHEVTGIARHAPLEPLPGGVRFVSGSIEEARLISPLLAASDWLLHLAWNGTPGSSQGQPATEASANILPTARLLEAAQFHRDCAVMFVSTGGALHAGNGAAATESGPIRARSYYGAAKASVELMLQAMADQTGHRAVVLRPSNVYGPGQPAKAGFGVIPALMRCALEGLAFEVLGDGSTARDFLYVADFCEVVGKSLSLGARSGGVDVLNAGSGTLVSINALCDHVARLSGMPIERRFREARTVDPPQVVLDSRRAHALLDWQPRVSIEEGLRLKIGRAHV